MISASNNKRIAKNTMFLYIRTIVVLFVMLYTSRLILQALGAQDLGIYNVVGGIVALMSFFQTSLTKATSRFITYELGCNSGNDRLKSVFSMAMSIHVIIAIIAIIIGETLGLYILEHWTSIPVERQSAGLWVYQCSLLIFCIHIIRVPYDSVIIAHENMSAYAYMSILEAFLQLLLVFILLNYSGDKLFAYGSLMLGVTFILFLCYFSYARNKFSQYRFRFLWDKNYSLKILSFSGWSLLGSSANVATQQGVSLLFNNFIGLLANTALGFANQVNGAVGKFVGNFTTAFNPQIIKLCAQQNYEQLYLLMNRASKFSFVLIWIMCLPLIANMDFVLYIWLGEVPTYTTEFCQMILICSVIDATTGIYNTAITATGKIKKYQIAISVSFLLDLFFAFLLLELNFAPALVFGSRIFTRGIFNMFIGWYFANKQTGFNLVEHCRVVWVPILVTAAISVPCVFLVCTSYSGWFCLICSTIVSSLIIFLCTYLLIMNSEERKSIKSILKKISK